MVKLLIDKRADVNGTDSRGFTALMGAVYSGHSEIVQMLIANGADINAKDHDGKNALIWAEEKGEREEIVALLKKSVK